MTIDVRIHNSNDGYSWIRLVFVLAQMNYSPKVLMGIMDIQEQKRNMEFLLIVMQYSQRLSRKMLIFLI